jgi:hypothetical protein
MMCVLAFSALLKEFTADAKHHPENAATAHKLVSTVPRSAVWNGAAAEKSVEVAPAVSFPCALVSSDKSWQLEESSTFFFVLSVEYPGKDDHVSCAQQQIETYLLSCCARVACLIFPFHAVAGSEILWTLSQRPVPGAEWRS